VIIYASVLYRQGPPDAPESRKGGVSRLIYKAEFDWFVFCGHIFSFFGTLLTEKLLVWLKLDSEYVEWFRKIPKKGKMGPWSRLIKVCNSKILDAIYNWFIFLWFRFKSDNANNVSLPSPPGYNPSAVQAHAESSKETDSSHLIIKKSWDLALGPLKQVNSGSKYFFRLIIYNINWSYYCKIICLLGQFLLNFVVMKILFWVLYQFWLFGHTYMQLKISGQ